MGFVISGWDLSNMGGICQIWAPIHYGTVMKYVANNFRMVFFLEFVSFINMGGTLSARQQQVGS